MYGGLGFEGSVEGSWEGGREGKGREGKGREGKGREGKGREGKGREGKGREGRAALPYALSVTNDPLTFSRELVRKKAVMAMHHFYILSPGVVSHLEDDFRRCISDQDPGVMEAALILFHDMANVRSLNQASPCSLSLKILVYCCLHPGIASSVALQQI